MRLDLELVGAAFLAAGFLTELQPDGTLIVDLGIGRRLALANLESDDSMVELRAPDEDAGWEGSHAHPDHTGLLLLHRWGDRDVEIDLLDLPAALVEGRVLIEEQQRVDGRTLAWLVAADPPKAWFAPGDAIRVQRARVRPSSN